MGMSVVALTTLALGCLSCPLISRDETNRLVERGLHNLNTIFQIRLFRLFGNTSDGLILGRNIICSTSY